MCSTMLAPRTIAISTGLLLATALLASARPAAADAGDVIASFPAPGDSASGLGWDGSHLWVANLQTALGGGSNRVSRHDPISGAELSGFDMKGSDVFHGLAFDGSGAIWTDNFNKASILDTDIVKIDALGNTLAVYPAHGTIYGVALAADGRLFQVDNHSVEPGGDDQPSELYVLDGGMKMIVGPVALGLQAARGVAFDGVALWVASNASDSLYRVDVATGATLAQFTAPGQGGVEGLAWDGQCLWVSDTRGDTIYRVHHGQSDLPACVPLEPIDPAVDGGAGGAGGAASDRTSSVGGAEALPAAPDPGGDAPTPSPPQQRDDAGEASHAGCAVGEPPARTGGWGVALGLALAWARARRRRSETTRAR
jgi:MYXO-CTERM domain-containing protein